jgi:hypothetical protein
MSNGNRTTFDRRRSPRYAAEAFVYLSQSGLRPKRCRVINQSSSGVFLRGRLPLIKGLAVELVFVSHDSAVAQLDRRQAIVMHVSPQGAGVLLYHPGLPRPSLQQTH